MNQEDDLATLSQAFTSGCDVAHPKLHRALALEQEAAGYRHDVGLQLRGGLTTGSGVGDLVDQKNTGDRNYLELIWDLLGNG